ncbi:hypothetical protein L6654_07135 [Bradyrhizobium sp. WYCCWR 13023]|uniref:Uncharacterized protein n=1 Tax=Bradyrhizobium zhengyangense TaxID=2911009 RepID=A0A9X1R6Q9_9BRAD|nr:MULTISPECIES: hypothetical protein [Bradyrhizobium]MCG2626396.1 hypothetical protein [Bradyrhizobium zhengyangense]MCG2640553.1 hypothetical protein [Bradyrhizobium zhengyangense]MCG2665900.1 hypothetical protein [Bradyrhizobium zhengyangense]MDA9523922.1 hypothetical protein [Bradyrhizobium sp. CCBAU 11434]
MIFFRLSLKALAIVVAAVAVVGAVLLAARPQPIESTVLGAAWECTQTAFILTSCAPRTQQAIPAVETLRKEAVRQTKG